MFEKLLISTFAKVRLVKARRFKCAKDLLKLF